jgi:hypothetical protein
VPVLRGRDAAGLEPGEHRLHHLGQPQPARQVLLRREARLRVHHAVGGEIDRALVGHAIERLGCLHHADRVLERLEITLKRPGVRRRGEPGAQRDGVVRRQFVPDVRRQFDDCRGP